MFLATMFVVEFGIMALLPWSVTPSAPPLVTAVVDGAVLTAVLAPLVWFGFVWPAGGGAPVDTLSEREREVLVLVAQGHTNQQIADRLSLSVKTIESYRSRLMGKLGLTNRAELTPFVLEAGLMGGR